MANGKRELSPFQEGVAKGLKDRGTVMATEAIDNNVPPQHIEQQAGLTPGGTPAPAQQPAPNQAQQPAAPLSIGGQEVDQSQISIATSDANLGTLIDSFSKIKVPTEQRLGIIPSILSGGGILRNDRAFVQKELGIEGGAELLKDLLSIKESMANLPLKESQLQESLLKVTKSLGRRDLFEKMGGVSPEGFIEEDPFTGRLTERGLSQEARGKEIAESRKSLNKYSSDAFQSIVAIDKVAKMAANLPDFQRGIIGQTGARIETKVGEFAAKKEITRFIGVVNQELIPFARKLAEEKGPITEFDVNRIQKGLGEIHVPNEDKFFLLSQLVDKVSQAVDLKIQVAELSESEAQRKFGKLLNRMAKLKTSLDEKSGNLSFNDRRARLAEQISIENPKIKDPNVIIKMVNDRLGE